MKICNQFGSLGKCTKSSMWILSSVGRGGVRPWLPTGKVYEAVTTVFMGFEFELMDDEA